MRAQVLKSFNTPYEFSDIPKPSDPTGHQLLIQVLAASYCHTDAVFASGGDVAGPTARRVSRVRGKGD